MLVTQIQSNKTWLKDSWRRSVQAGLSSRKQPDDRRIDGAEIKSRTEKHQSLIQVVEQHAYPLFCQIFSRTDSRLILADTHAPSSKRGDKSAFVKNSPRLLSTKVWFGMRSLREPMLSAQR